MDTLETKKTILKGGEFLVKETDPQDIFIIEDRTDEQQAFIDAANEFIDKRIAPNYDAIEHKEFDKVVTLLEEAGELGLLGMGIPEEYGGMGADFSTDCLVSEGFGRAQSFNVAITAHVGIGTLPIYYFVYAFHSSIVRSISCRCSPMDDPRPMHHH